MRRVMRHIEMNAYDNSVMVRGGHLHLECSELIESLRGKGSTAPAAEAADVLYNLLALLAPADIKWADVLVALDARLGPSPESCS